MTHILARLAGILMPLALVAACSVSDLGFGGKQNESEAQFPNVNNAPASTPAAAPAATTARSATVYYAPIVGAPVNLVAALSKRLVEVGRANGIQPAPANTQGLNHEIKGYFSAFTENGSTTIVHVWDIVTPSGQRVHRIQGEHSVPGATADPWQSVTPQAMEAIATTVMTQYVTWLKSGA
ncbi:hypothetical protein [Oricola sp.]|uniref:hypothetical protein n=1 Tax=Oricola sp. TaxID=1979950 RepID=UPI0025EA3CAB|nr:hypothetical protein [Oricola sp.]MCI5074352.1 hypothetical protein [Oricola sp.]